MDKESGLAPTLVGGDILSKRAKALVPVPLFSGEGMDVQFFYFESVYSESVRMGMEGVVAFCWCHPHSP